MKHLEAKIKHGLANMGIKCQSVYMMPTYDETRILIAFNSKDNKRLSIKRVEDALTTLNVGDFKVSQDFQRLSSSFLHLEVTFGARTEREISTTAS